MIFFPANETVALSLLPPQNFKASSAHGQAVAGCRNLVGSYGGSNRGYLLRKISDRIHFVHYEKNRYEEMSPGYGSMEEALAQAYLDAKRRGPFHLREPWCEILKGYYERSMLGGFAVSTPEQQLRSAR